MPDYEKGCLWEDYPWSIEKDEVARYCKKTVCTHCQELTPEDPRWEHWLGTGREKEEGPQWICPFVVVAQNEGGHSDTGVCLLCILKAAAELGVEEVK